MATKIFVNLPVKNLDATKAFFTKLGFTYNPQFTDEKAACMIVGEDIFVMLLMEDFLKHLRKKNSLMPLKPPNQLYACLPIAENR